MAQPIYIMIFEDIKKKINTGILKGGVQLPTEFELKEHYHTSKSTVRKALKILADDGYINTVQRIGHFINEPNKKDYILYFDETDMQFGIDHVDVFSINVVMDLNKVFQACPQKKALEVKSIFKSAEIPVGYDKKYIIYDKGINLDSRTFEYIEILEILSQQVQLFQLKKELSITGVRANSEVSKQLSVKENDYVIRVEHCYYDQIRTLLTYCVTYYRTNFIKLFAKSR